MRDIILVVIAVMCFGAFGFEIFVDYGWVPIAFAVIGTVVLIVGGERIFRWHNRF